MPYPKDTETLNNHLLMTNQKGYKDNSDDRAGADAPGPQRSCSRMRATPCEDGQGHQGRQGRSRSTYVYNDGSKTNEAVVPVVQEKLAAVGITMKVQKVPPTDLFAKYVDPRRVST